MQITSNNHSLLHNS